MEIIPKREKLVEDKFGWSKEEQRFLFLFAHPFVLSLPDGSTITTEASARWDYNSKVVMIRTLDGFERTIENIDRKPSLSKTQELYEESQNLWHEWNRDRSTELKKVANG